MRVSLRLSASISARPSSLSGFLKLTISPRVVSHAPFIGGGCACTNAGGCAFGPKCVFLGEDGGLKEQDEATGLVLGVLAKQMFGRMREVCRHGEGSEAK